MSEDERFDGILMNVAQQAGSIDAILDTFFGFLQRKTDFFTGGQDEKSAEELILKHYRKHAKVGLKRRQETNEKNRIADEERKKKAEEKKKQDEEEYAARQKAMAQEPQIEEVTDEEAAKIVAQKSGATGGKTKENLTEKKADGEEEEEEESKEAPPEGNGGTTSKYKWTQTLSALEVFVPVKPGVRAKQLIVDIGVSTLKVGVKGDSFILDGKMFDKVKPDDCMWTLVDNKTVQITLEKHDGMKWWSCVMQGDPQIDTKKIVPDNSKLSDLDGETRQTVEKMMYDQRQKALGKPSSDQEKQHDLLEKFKAAHPEMDFSQAKINYGGGPTGGGMNF